MCFLFEDDAEDVENTGSNIWNYHKVDCALSKRGGAKNIRYRRVPHHVPARPRMRASAARAAPLDRLQSGAFRSGGRPGAAQAGAASFPRLRRRFRHGGWGGIREIPALQGSHSEAQARDTAGAARGAERRFSSMPAQFSDSRACQPSSRISSMPAQFSDPGKISQVSEPGIMTAGRGPGRSGARGTGADFARVRGTRGAGQRPSAPANPGRQWRAKRATGSSSGKDRPGPTTHPRSTRRTASPLPTQKLSPQLLPPPQSPPSPPPPRVPLVSALPRRRHSCSLPRRF